MVRNSASFNDIVKCLRSYRLIVFMAVSDLRARYKRSVLGPFWLTLSTAVGAAGLGFLWSELMQAPKDSFVPMLTAGLILWYLISGVIVESASIFAKNGSLVRNINLPLTIYPLMLILRHLINFLHTIPVFFIVAFLVNYKITDVSWWAVPGLILLTLNLIWVGVLIGLLGARFRDLEFLLITVMPLLMLISPVFYRPNFLPFSENIIWMNPISHLIEVVRYPLLGSEPPVFVIQINLLMLLFGTAFTFWFFNKKYYRVSFWL